jgi:Tfp pilus assembly protein PilN
MFFLVSAILIYLNLRFTSATIQLESEIHGIQTELSRYEAKGQMVSEIRKQLDTLKMKIEVLQHLKLRQQSMVQRLEDIVKSRPDETVEIVKLAQEGKQISIEGRAVDVGAIESYKHALKTLAWVGSVEGSTSPLATPRKTKPMAFNLLVREKQPVPVNRSEEHQGEPPKRMRKY